MAEGPDGAWIEEGDLPPGPIDLFIDLGCTAPVEIDIGFGKGRSLVEWAAAVLDGTLLGVERRRGLTALAAARLARAGGASRVRLFRGDVRALLPRLGPSGSIRRAWFHFPDPWWKKRHLKRQVVSEAVLAALTRLLVSGGELFVQTDVPERAEQFRAALAGTGLSERLLSDGAGNPFGVRSNREVRCVEAGVAVHRLLYVKPG
jgi:tRNA (guanine-N7-)-methyltransferase